jgi:hypothetical protein
MYKQQFELRRQSDDLVYSFTRKLRPDGETGYQRSDRDVWIVFRPDFGWIALGDDNHSITGIAWGLRPKDQSADFPPEGDWVSKKGPKSYVYQLVYI